MEDSWCKLVLAWANGLSLTPQPAQQLIDLTDGHFCSEFMKKHLPSWAAVGQTKTDTFKELEVSSGEYNGRRSTIYSASTSSCSV